MTSPHTGSLSAQTTLQRRIGLYGATAIVVGSMIGSGIFRSPAGVARNVPDATWMLIVWLIGGLVALCGALTLAELGSASPETGGIYVFIRNTWGRLPAFLFGWTELILIRPASTGAIAMTCAEYTVRAVTAMQDTMGGTAGVATSSVHMPTVRAVAIIALLITMWVNVIGVRSGARVQSIFTSVKCGALLLIIVSALVTYFLKDGASETATAATTNGLSTLGSTVSSMSIAGVGLALVSVLWVYDGWADVSFVGGEIKDPQRTLPRALVGGTLLVIVLYLLANLAYLSVLSVDAIGKSPLVAADVAGQIFGTSGILFVGAAVAVSTFGTLAATMLTGPRILWATAQDGLLFAPLGKVHPKTATPYVAILTTGVLGSLFILVGTFEQLADAFVTSILPFYALAVAAVFPLQRLTKQQTQQSALDREQFRTPGYPITPIVFIVGVLFLLGSTLIDTQSRTATLFVFFLILLGVPVYKWQTRRSGVVDVR